MHILSFDIEEWFHILDHEAVENECQWGAYETRLPANVDRILNLLDQNGSRATFFCLGWIGRRFPTVVRRIVDRGHEIASHSDVHGLVYKLSPADFAQDLKSSKSTLEDVSGQPVRAYRAPGFSLTKECDWFFDILIESGFEVDCSVFPAPRAHGGYEAFKADRPTWVACRSGRIKEFPMNVAHALSIPFVFSGGGYFRLLPRALIYMLMKRHTYVMTYFHPRDFDAEQPMINGLSPLRRFKSYYGLGRAEDKLRYLLERIHFITLSEAESQIDWSLAPVFVQARAT